tara:strand:- start:202 stop:744 length:543 start_codon:yes stop_codon:yes gene_type:complete
MTDITSFKRNVQVEETEYKSAVSESTAQKLGGSINFINTRQYDLHSFNLNGAYQLGVGSTGVDGLYPVVINMELVAITIYSVDAGVSGTTTFDIHWLSSSGADQGSIFSTKPSINSSAPNNAFGIKGLVTEVLDFGGTGITLPVLSKTQFNQGNALRFDIDAAMSSAQNAGLTFHFRPRN